jgi:thiamine biosynthesis lipoprotein
MSSSATSTAAPAEFATVRLTAFGTFVELVVTDPGAIEVAERTLRAELVAIDLACSRFRADSDLMRANRAHGRAVPVGPLLSAALAVALAAAERTDGLVDPMVGRALIAAGYDRDFAQLPADGPSVRAEPCPAGAWRRVRLDAEAGIVLVPRGTALDLGATAKAFAADRCAALVAEATGAGALVCLGGDIAMAGSAPAGGWPVRIGEAPDDDGPTTEIVLLADGGLATSSPGARRWRRGGHELHHILDPRTGRPAPAVWRTVTVAAGSCADANTATTAAVVLGDAATEWLAETDLPARLVDAAGRVHRLGGWPEPTA